MRTMTRRAGFLITMGLGIAAAAFAGGKTETMDSGPVTLTYFISERPDAAVKADWPVVQEIEKAVGVKIQFEPVPTSGSQEKMQILIATNSIPDLTSASPTDARRYGPDGVFLNMKSLVQKAPSIQKLFSEFPDAKVLGSAQDGGIYSIPAVQRKNWFSAAWMGRKDLWEKIGLKPPRTTDEFRAFLTQLKKAYPDSYPLTTRDLTNVNGLYRVFTRAFTEVDGMLGYNSVSKKYEFAPAKREFYQMLEYLIGLYKDGLLDPEYPILKSNQWEERMLTGKGLVTYDYKTRPEQLNAKAAGASPGSGYEVATLPMFAASGKKAYQASEQVISGRGGIAIGAKTKHPEAAMKVIDFLFSEKGVMLTTYGVEGKSYEMKDGKPSIFASLGTDPAPALRRDFGALYDGLWMDASLYDPARSVAFMETEKAYLPNILPPSPQYVETAQELEIVKDVTANLQPYLMEMVTKFILLGAPLTEANYSAFVEQANKLGAEKLVALRNAQIARSSGR